GCVLSVPSAPFWVSPPSLACSASGCVALARMAPEAGPAAILVGLPNVWYTYPVLALPQVVVLLRSRLRRAALVAIVASSFVLPLANLLLTRVILVWMGWRGGVAPPVAAVMTAVQPAGFVALLILSVALGRTGAEGTGNSRALGALPAVPGV